MEKHMEYDIRKNATQYNSIRFADVSDIERSINVQEAVLLQTYGRNEILISSADPDYTLVINSKETALNLISALQHAIQKGWFGDKVLLNEGNTLNRGINTNGI
jgi:glutamyl-tRNA reductase